VKDQQIFTPVFLEGSSLYLFSKYLLHPKHFFGRAPAGQALRSNFFAAQKSNRFNPSRKHAYSSIAYPALRVKSFLQRQMMLLLLQYL
jgi:hypothetical protein